MSGKLYASRQLPGVQVKKDSVHLSVLLIDRETEGESVCV